MGRWLLAFAHGWSEYYEIFNSILNILLRSSTFQPKALLESIQNKSQANEEKSASPSYIIYNSYHHCI